MLEGMLREECSLSDQIRQALTLMSSYRSANAEASVAIVFLNVDPDVGTRFHV